MTKPKTIFLTPEYTPTRMNDATSVGTELRRIYRAVANGTLDPRIGTKLTYIAREVGQFVVLRELQERLTCLEEGRAYLPPEQRATLIEATAEESNE